MRKTKILATLGPSTESEEMIEKLIESGVDVFRLNFSHGDHETHLRNIQKIRKISKKLKKPTAILQDLSGPKIRIGVVEEPFYLHYEDTIKIVKEEVVGNKERISINHPEILDQLKEGSYIYISDGTIRLQVVGRDSEGITAKVIVGGMVSSRKGVNFPNVKLNIPSLTEKDKKDLKFAIEEDIDIIALSFVKTPEDVLEAKELAKSHGGDVPIYAKIEKHEAIENIDSIIDVADGIMVARGDLGVEIDMEKVPVLQKMIIKKANEKGKPVITATQMLTSMVSSPRPTRAEVSDIANAVLDGTDAVMLSDETTVGKYPIEAVKVMERTILETEKVYPYFSEGNHTPTDPSLAVAYASNSLAKNLKGKAIAVFTKTGRTVRNVSRFRPECPILALTHDEKTLRRLNIVWGVKPYMIIKEETDTDRMLCEFIGKAYVEDYDTKDTIITLIGYVGSIPGSTNIIRILREGDVKQLLEECKITLR
ncbi:pyruvate kinase [Persephonella sp.]